MNGFEKRTQQKKRKILNTAFELFTTHGVQKVSIQEIAKKAQVSQVTIYNYFGSKEQMLVESIKDYYMKQIERFEKLVEDPESDFKEKIESIITIKSDNILSFNPDFIQTFISDIPELQSFIQEIMETHSMPLFIKLLEEGKQQGYVQQNISVDILMFYMNMFYEGIQKRKDLFETEESVQKFTDEILHLFFYGVMGKS
ncbi:TetR/AcrR family transcriptional regulator [Pontibacillus sp. HMF3514]|uniref:TetR/AcrR family transcriptional regulator n=1 Tax=Pontibacillus sp. HMF3514 TaxID=2692425 RepID=UPI00131FE4FA|nr:TetR/AcrR family transcriptional regulator [Pontibacillus sp. HMF3514]QHE51226.1 TetR family transcriptional regulator [Pontibacillus sp. HMF3514]